MGAQRIDRILLACGAVGAPLFVLVFLIDGATRPGYDPLYQPVSALSLGERGWVQTTNFIVTGLLLVGFAIGLRRSMAGRPGARWGPGLVGVFGLALLLSGVFAMDAMRGYPPGTPAGDPAQLSWQHSWHDGVGVVVFAALPVACLVLARWFAAATPARRRWVVYSLVSGGLGLAGLLAFGTAWEADHAYAGLIQKVVIGVGWGWLTAVALRLLADQRTSATALARPDRSG